MQHLLSSPSLQVSTGTCGWCMSSQAACPAPSPSSQTALETDVANSRSKASGRNTTSEPRWQEPATRPSGTTTSPNCTSSWLENKLKDFEAFSTWNYRRGCCSVGNSLKNPKTPTMTKHISCVPLNSNCFLAGFFSPNHAVTKITAPLNDITCTILQ